MDHNRVTQPPEEPHVNNDAKAKTVEQLQARLDELRKQANELQKQLDAHLGLIDPSVSPRE